MSLDKDNTKKDQAHVYQIGLLESEELLINSMFRMEKALNKKYFFAPPEEGQMPDLFFVNWDDVDALREWDKLHKANPHIVAIAVSEEEQLLKTYRSITRPLAFRKFIEILDAVTSSQVDTLDTQGTEEGIVLRTLVVDDSFPARQFMKFKLEELCENIVNIHLEFAEDGKSALEKLKSGSFDLIFLDVVMPGADGYEICHEIKEKQYKSRVVMLTGKDSKLDRARGYEAGCNHYIPKPPDDNALLDIIRLASRSIRLTFTAS